VYLHIQSSPWPWEAAGIRLPLDTERSRMCPDWQQCWLKSHHLAAEGTHFTMLFRAGMQLWASRWNFNFLIHKVGTVPPCSHCSAHVHPCFRACALLTWLGLVPSHTWSCAQSKHLMLTPRYAGTHPREARPAWGGARKIHSENVLGHSQREVGRGDSSGMSLSSLLRGHPGNKVTAHALTGSTLQDPCSAVC
jgi:hypothetical protein